MEMPVHILHIVDNLGKGGLENGVANLISRLDPRRFRHTVCAIRRLGANADCLPKENVKILCMEMEGKRSFSQFPAFSRLIRDVQPDVLHSRNWPAIESVFAGRLRRSCGIIHSEHGLDWNSKLNEPKRRMVMRRMAFNYADQVLCVSHELKALHAKRTGFNPGKMIVIHNGVDTQRYVPRAEIRSRLRAEHGIAPTEFCIGCVGNLTPVKGYPVLFEALETFERTASFQHGPDWRLLLIGDGPERGSLEQFANSRGWSNRIRFLGLRNEVPELLNAFDLYVLPSLSEGISNSLLEAMATGLPALASNTGGNPEVVEDRISGRLFPVGNSAKLAEELMLLYHNADLRQQLGRAAIVRVEQEFSMSSMVQQYEQLYSTVAANSARARRMPAASRSSFQTEEFR